MADQQSLSPRACRIDQFSPAEKAIYNAQQAVESVGAHPALTEAAVLLAQARAKVAEYVDREVAS